MKDEPQIFQLTTRSKRVNCSVCFYTYSTYQEFASFGLVSCEINHKVPKLEVWLMRVVPAICLILKPVCLQKSPCKTLGIKKGLSSSHRWRLRWHPQVRVPFLKSADISYRLWGVRRRGVDKIPFKRFVKLSQRHFTLCCKVKLAHTDTLNTSSLTFSSSPGRKKPIIIQLVYLLWYCGLKCKST